jgi:hypothetical protein
MELKPRESGLDLSQRTRLELEVSERAAAVEDLDGVRFGAPLSCLEEGELLHLTDPSISMGGDWKGSAEVLDVELVTG